MEKSLKRRRYHMAAPLGFLIIVLCIVGIITLVTLGVNYTMRLLDNSSAKERFARIIQPVLMFDPAPFDDVVNVDNLSLLRSSIWAAVTGDKGASYPNDDVGRIMVPRSDVDAAAVKLFGSSVTLEHLSFGDYEISYIYNEETDMYHVPVTAQVSYYTARVISIKRSGDIYNLVVGYVPPGNAWTMAVEGDVYEPDPDKYMLYQMRQVDNNYILVAIKDPQPEDLPASVTMHQGG